MKYLIFAAGLLGTVAGEAAAQKSEPLVIGESFILTSKVLGEARRINVYAPAAFTDTAKTPLPVLYMPDGGLAEDFLHVAGLVQIGAGNGTMRPFLLVGIENTQRRRDLTGPTENPEDRKIAPRVGGSAAFRAFIREELMPFIASRYRTSSEKGIVGESLAGLFVVETLLVEPGLFDTYIAFDPSVWWNRGELVKRARTHISSKAPGPKRLYLANSTEDIDDLTRSMADTLQAVRAGWLDVRYQPMAQEKHSTIFHPAAIQAFRFLFPVTTR